MGAAAHGAAVHFGHAERRILAVNRISGKPQQRGMTRTTVTVRSLKSRDPAATTILFSTDDVAGGSRFALKARP